MTTAVLRLAAAVPLPDATAVVLLVAAATTLVVGALRGRGDVVRWLPGALFVLLAAACFHSALPARWTSGVAVAAAIALLAHLAVGLRDGAASEDGARPRIAVVYLAVAVVLAGMLMFHELGTYAGTLQRWEATVVYGFGRAFGGGEGPARYALEQLRWNNGILSLGAQSWFFGVPTYALFHALGFSTWTLRALAVVAMLANVVVLFALARRFFGPLAAGGAAMALALDECALFYGRYGSSPAGTILAVLLLVFSTWLFLERARPAWWMGLACAAALYAATLQYAVARIVVLFVLGFVPLALVCQWRRLDRRRVLGAGILYVAAAAIWLLQGPRGREVFLFGQGEQFFYMTKFPDYVASFCPTCPQLLPDQTAYQLALLRRWLATTIPQYVELVGPHVERGGLRDWGAPILPHLYYGPAVVLLALGMVVSLRRAFSVPHAFLLLWTAGATVPLLLASRVDSHRIMLFVVPLALWIGLGVAQAARIMTRAGVPGALQHLFAAAFCVTVVAYDVRILWTPGPPVPRSSRVLADEIERIPGPVAVGALIDPPHDTTRDFEFVELSMLERQRRDAQRTGVVVPYPLLTKLRDAGAGAADADLVELDKVVGDATLVLAPATTFRGLAEALERRGLRVSEGGAPDFALLRLRRAAATATGG